MGSEEKKERFKILQVSNISMAATKDQIYTMFQYIGRIDDLKVYPSEANVTSTTTQKTAFIKYDDDRCVEVGQHLTNIVLIDRALICVPWMQNSIPDENTFMISGGPATAGQRQLPPHVVNKIQTDGDGVSLLLTVDPTLEQLGLPGYPPLPGDTDAAKVEEIRRTIYIGNLPKGIDGQAVSDFFNSYIGEVMYVRLATGPDTLPCAYAYVEFSQQNTVPIALQNNGIEFQGRLLKIQHSRVAIIKPQQKTADQALEEVEEAIRMGKTTGTEERPRTRSPRRRRSPSPRRGSRDRERERRRSRSRKRSRSRDKERKRSRSRERKRSRSRDRRTRRSRSRDRRTRKSRSRSRDRKKDKERERERDKKDRDRKRSRSRSRDRKKDKDRRDRSRSSDRKRTKDKDSKPSDKVKDESDALSDENTLREKLVAKAAARSSGAEGSVSDMDVDEDKMPSKIKNERKRNLSDSD